MLRCSGEAQRENTALPKPSPPHSLRTPRQVISVGLGSPESARAFAAALDYPSHDLYADPTGGRRPPMAFGP